MNIAVIGGGHGALATAADLALRGHQVRTAMRTHHLPAGVYPARDSQQALAVVRAAYPELEAAEDALDAGLLNSNGALHAPLVLMNAAPIERLGAYDIHVEGTTPA